MAARNPFSFHTTKCLLDTGTTFLVFYFLLFFFFSSLAHAYHVQRNELSFIRWSLKFHHVVFHPFASTNSFVIAFLDLYAFLCGYFEEFARLLPIQVKC
jgi:hypothetical protein